MVLHGVVDVGELVLFEDHVGGGNDKVRISQEAMGRNAEIGRLVDFDVADVLHMGVDGDK